MRPAAVALLLVAAAKFPAFTAPVVDAAGVVPAAVEQQVDAALQDYQDRSGFCGDRDCGREAVGSRTNDDGVVRLAT